jgi:pimeloyl-ACP methyl ester carboxylesterase
MAADLQSLMDVLGIRHAMVVGHSFGGVIALSLAATQPRRVTRLAIADSRVNALQPEQRLQDGPALTNFETALVEATGADDWLQETQVGLRFLEEVATSRLRGMRVRKGGEFVPFSAFNGSPRAALRWERLLTETTAKKDFRAPVDLSKAHLARIEQPTLLVYGGRSRCLPSCWALANVLPNREVVVVPRAGHFHPVVRPRVFVRHLLDFLVRERPVKAETMQQIALLEDQPEPEDVSAN